jgi:hypothetical protein
LNVKPATKSPLIPRRHAHLAEYILLLTPGKGDLMDVTMNVLWLSGTSTCICRSLPFLFSNPALPS